MTSAAGAEEVSENPPAHRTAFVAAVIAYYAAWTVFWMWGPPSLVALLEQIQNVTPVAILLPGPPYAHFPTPFIDIATIFSWRDCFLQGVDVTVDMPCDPMLRAPANYSPLVWHLPLEWIGLQNIVATALVIDTLFLLLVFSMFRPQGRAECLVMVLAMVSPVTFFALERCNPDVLIFFLLLGAFHLPQKQGWARAAAYGAIWTGGLLKFYPFVLLVAALRERPRQFLILAATSLAGIAAFFLWQWPYFARLILPKELVFGMFGARLLGKGLQQELGLPLMAQTIITVLCFAASYAAMLVLARKFAKPVGALNLLDRNAGAMACGAILTLACFFSGFNVYYRAIFLLPVIPCLFDLLRNTKGQPVQKYFGLGLLATVGCLYADMFGFAGTKILKLAFRIDPDSPPGHFATAAILVAKEAVWWLEISLLGGILIAALPHAQTVKQSLNYVSRRHRSAAAA